MYLGQLETILYRLELLWIELISGSASQQTMLETQAQICDVLFGGVDESITRGQPWKV